MFSARVPPENSQSPAQRTLDWLYIKEIFGEIKGVELKHKYNFGPTSLRLCRGESLRLRYYVYVFSVNSGLDFS